MSAAADPHAFVRLRGTMYVRVRRATAILLSVLVCTMGLATGAVAVSSPLGDSAAPWPTAWRGYTLDTGDQIMDEEGEAGISPPGIDISSNIETASSVLLASDGTNVFFRVRVQADPRDAAKGGFDSAFWLAQIAVDGVVKAIVGLNGKPTVIDYVYITDVGQDNTVVVYETPFNALGGQISTGARALSDGTGQWYIDWQVPIARLTALSGGAITATTPVQLFYGSSKAATLDTINKDFMIGDEVSWAGLSVTNLDSAHLNLSTNLSVSSGVHPPQTTHTTTFDLDVIATNPGGGSVANGSIQFTLPAGVTLHSSSTASGSIAVVGSAVTWSPDDDRRRWRDSQRDVQRVGHARLRGSRLDAHPCVVDHWFRNRHGLRVHGRWRPRLRRRWLGLSAASPSHRPTARPSSRRMRPTPRRP